MNDSVNVEGSRTMNGFFSRFDTRTLVSAVAFCAVFILSVVGLRMLGFWQNHFYDTGLYPVAYNALRAVLFLYAICMCVSIGWAALGYADVDAESSETGDAELDATIMSTYTGAAIFGIAGCLLGLIGALSLPWVLLLLLPVVAYTGLHLRRLGRLFGNLAVGLTGDVAPALGLLVLLGVGVFVLISRGTQPDPIMVDTLGHYIPFYDDALSRGKADTHIYFLTYFFGRGAGLQWLFSALTDPNFFHLTSFFYHFLAGLVVLRLTSEMFPPKSAAPFLLAALYLVAPTSLTAEFAKVHVSAGAVILGLLYFSVALQRSGGIDRPKTLRALLVVSAGFAILSPTSVVFGGALIAFALLIALLRRDSYAARGLFVSGALMGALVVIGLAYNYLSSGMAEITPFSIATKMSDPARRPAALLLWETWYLGTQEGGTAAAWRSLIGQSPFDALAILADALWRKFAEGIVPGAITALIGLPVLFGLIGVRLFVRPRGEAFFDATAIVVVSAVFVLLLTFALQLVIVQESLGRTLTFLDGMRVLVLGAALAQVARFFASRDKPRSTLSLTVSNVVAVLVALQAFLTVNYLYASSQLRKPVFTFGASSYGEFVGLGSSPGTDACVLARDAVSSTAPILLLHFIPACYGHPMAKLERPDMNSFNDVQDKVYAGDAETAKALLRERNVNYFLFAAGQPMHIFAFAPLFQPESLQKNFGVFKILANNIMVLTWKDKATADIPSQSLAAAQTIFNNSRRSKEYAAYEQYRAMLAGP